MCYWEGCEPLNSQAVSCTSPSPPLAHGWSRMWRHGASLTALSQLPARPRRDVLHLRRFFSERVFGVGKTNAKKKSKRFPHTGWLIWNPKIDRTQNARKKFWYKSSPESDEWFLDFTFETTYLMMDFKTWSSHTKHFSSSRAVTFLHAVSGWCNPLLQMGT